MELQDVKGLLLHVDFLGRKGGGEEKGALISVCSPARLDDFECRPIALKGFSTKTNLGRPNLKGPCFLGLEIKGIAYSGVNPAIDDFNMA
jgi:hypothetical protein